jgi:hypothetical protein
VIRLWAINRVLRWTGFVLLIEADERPHVGCTSQGVCSQCNRRHWPTTLGVKWVGLPPDRAWARYCDRELLAVARRETTAAKVESINAIARDAVETVRKAVGS